MLDQRAIQLITRKLAGEITVEEKEELQYLMAVDPDVAEYFRVCSEIWHKDAEPGKEAVAAAYEKHLQRFEQDFKEKGGSEERFQVPLTQRFSKWVWYAAACLLLLAGVGTWFFMQHGKRPANSAVLAKNVVQSTDGRKRLLLPDNTVVWLNKNSRLSFDLDNFTKASRTVYLEGEGFFDVAKMQDHPFIIHTPKLVVKVLGTSFNVKAYASSPTEATLISGAIQLEVNDKAVKPVVLKAREKFTLDKCAQCDDATTIDSTAGISVAAIEPVLFSHKEYIEEIAWMNHQLVFRNKSFSELATDMEQWFGVSIRINKDAIAQYRFTGAFENETLSEALLALQTIRPFKFTIHQNQVAIF